MKKADIANTLFERVGISRKESGQILEMTLDLIKDTLKEGETVKLAGFGNFVIRKKNERNGRNPKTGQKIGITPRKVISFKASQGFKKRVEKS
jgi:integration host factor subunit alpha